MDFDLEAFYRERDDIMNQPDEDLDDYWKRMASGVKFHFGTQDNTASNFAPFPLQEDSNESAAEGDCNRPSAGPRSSLQRVSSMVGPSIGPIARETALSHPGAPTPSVSPTSGREKMFNDQHEQRNFPDFGLPVAAIDNVDKMYEPETGSRANSIVIKRGTSPIHSPSPAKRQRGGKPQSTTDDISSEHCATPVHKSQIAGPTQTKFTHNVPETGEEENERPSEILSFTPSPEHIPRKRSLPGLPSPIGSFSPGLTPCSNPKSGQSGQIPQIFRTGSKKQLTHNGSWQHHLDADNPPTSPIEDPSLQNILSTDKESYTKGIKASGSTRLSLEVKERVTKHAAMKRRDKVMPVKTERTELAISERSQSNKDLDQERIAASGSSRAILPLAPEALKPKGGRRSNVPSKAQKKQNSKKEKPLMTPAEYAQQLLDKEFEVAEGRKSSVIKFLEGKYIFYIGGDMRYAGERTRKRMELILKYGGHLMPTFDPAIVTHIVADATQAYTLRVLGYNELSDIPDHIPTVKWDWILSAIDSSRRLSKEDIVAKMEEVCYYAAFKDRMDISTSRGGVPNVQALDDKTPGLSTPGVSMDHARSSPPENRNLDALKRLFNDSASPQPYVDTGKAREISGKRTGGKPSIDPLAEFYAEARAACENNWSHFADSDESDDDDVEPIGDEPTRVSQTKQKRGWTCDMPQASKLTCINQDIIEKLQELQEVHKAKVGDEEHWRAYSYNTSIRAIRTYPKRIQSYSEARSIRGVGDKTALKIMEILQTGDLRRINYEKTDDVKVTRLFQGIYGVGQSTAFKWYNAGCRTLEDLRNQKGGVRLSSAQMIGLQYYHDINNRMPRAEAKAIFELIKPIALSLDSKLFVEIMGSFRRGKADCGDIDILITRPTDDGQTHSGILKRLLAALHKGGIITEDLAIPENLADLEGVYRGLCRLPSPGARRRRIDFLTVPWENRGAALLYYTGDDIFNRAMRLKANKMGFSLNQRGLFSGVVRDVRESRVKLNQGTLVASETEEEIFRILNVPWQEPHERVRG